MNLESVQNLQLLDGQPKCQVVGSVLKSVEKSTEPPICGRVSLQWNQLSYKVANNDLWKTLFIRKSRQVCNREENVILHPQSGQVSTGLFIGVLGKSGSGKTTLLECLAGRRKEGLNGNIVITESGNKPESVNISFILQQDNLLATLTVEESLGLASKLKNSRLSDSKAHVKIINELITQLDLESCRRVYAGSCSGGQRKRLSIALELVSKPKILILDEPTSGLDSKSALECVQLLRTLTEHPTEPLAILATIHQPNAEIFSTLHQLYLMSYDGRCIFYGPSTSLLQRFSDHGLQCPKFHNPADYAMEIACGDYGQEAVYQLEQTQRRLYESSNKFRESKDDVVVVPVSTVSVGWSASQTGILFKRSLLTTFRDPMANSVKIIALLSVGIVIALVRTNEISIEGGCLFEGLSFEEIMNKQLLTTQNIGLLFFMLLFIASAWVVSTTMCFPTEFNVFRKETGNGSYSAGSYFVAKLLAELPFQVILTLAFLVIAYYSTGQMHSLWSFFIIWVICLLLTGIGLGYGLLASSLLSHNVTAAIFVGPALAFGASVVCGFFAKLSTMSAFTKFLAYTSFMRYAFEASLVSIYGFGRCDSDIQVTGPESNSRSLTQTETCVGLLQFLNSLNLLNVTYDSIEPLIEAYADAANMPDTQLDQLENQIVKVSQFRFNHTQWSQLNQRVSGVMIEYGLDDSLLYNHLIVLTGILISLQVMSYFVIHLKSKGCK